MSSRPSKHFERSRQRIYQLNANLGGEGTVTTEKYTQTHTLNTLPHELGPEKTQGMQWDR